MERVPEVRASSPPPRGSRDGEAPGGERLPFEPRALELPGAAIAAGWLAVPAVALLLVAAVVAFVRPLSRALTTSPSPFGMPLPAAAGAMRPEPREQATYLLALLVPAVASWALCVGWRRLPRVPDRALARGAIVVQALVGIGAAAACAYQAKKVHPYFASLRWVLGGVVVIAVLGAVRAATRSEELRAWAGSPAGRRLVRASGWIAAAAAAAYTAARLASVVFDDASVLGAPATVSYHLPFTLGEFAAVLNGRTPGADFFPQYAFVLPYALAPAFRTFGLTVRTFTVAMAALSFVALLLQFDVLRRVTGRPWVALALYVSFVALALHPVEVFPNGAVATAFSYFAVGPLRYFGPMVVSWLVSWHLSRPSAWRATVVFAAAGASALNNVDFGIPALGGALLAIGLTGERTLLPRPRAVLAVAALALAGLAASYAGFEVSAYVRSGRLVTLADMTLFQRAFAVLGFGMLPMPRFGLHVVVYATFMLGLGAALVRLEALRRMAIGQDDGARRERVLAGVLLYGSVFGAGALSYYVGRSHQAVLPAVFAAWGSVLVLLSWRGLQAAHRELGGRRIGVVPAALAVAALAVCAGEALPYRFEEARLYERGSRIGSDKVRYVIEAPLAATRLRERTSPREKVMVTYPAGHLTAQLAGVDDVFPFTEWDSCLVVGQLEEVVRRLRENGVTKYFGPASDDLRRRVAAEGLGVTFAEDLFPREPRADAP